MAPPGAVVGLRGSATIIEGPQSPWHFSHYNVYWARAEDTSTWHPIDNPHTTPVYKDTLAYWDTQGLPEGDYKIKLVLWDQEDSLDIVVGIRLQEMGSEETDVPREAKLWVSGGWVKLALPRAGEVKLVAFDPSGRLVRVLVDGKLERGEHAFKLSLKPGVYVLSLKGDFSARRAVLVP